MAGHSKFKNIMYRKGAQDKRRAGLFAKMAREIQVAVKEAGRDPGTNPRLRTILQKAKNENMPRDNIERAMRKGEGGGPEQAFEDMRYEGYGPSGSALLVEALTDNRNRTAGELRALFSKHGGQLAENGAVAFLFEKRGQIVYPLEVATPEAMFDYALEVGAQNIEQEDDEHILHVPAGALHDIAGQMEKQFGPALSVAWVWHPKDRLELAEDAATKFLKLLHALEDNEDVQNVSTNVELETAADPSAELPGS